MNLAYYWYEAAHAGLGPIHLATDAMRLAFSNPFNPLSYTMPRSHGRRRLRTLRADDAPLCQARLRAGHDGGGREPRACA